MPLSAGAQTESAQFAKAPFLLGDFPRESASFAGIGAAGWNDAEVRCPKGPMDCVLVSVRVPKSGSSSLSHLLRAAFSNRAVFPVPNTLNLDGRSSILQQFRFVRSRTQNLLKHYRTPRLSRAFEIISHRAAPGDLIDGGHIDFASVKAGVTCDLKMITILRDPAERCRSVYNYARMAYQTKPRLARLDAGVMPKTAARYSFDGFVDFLLERRVQYGDIACRYVGCANPEDFGSYFSRNVFLAGVLEEKDMFAKRLSAMLGKPLHFPHENQTRKPAIATVTRSQRARIEQIYPGDFALHEWVRSRT
jgi:Sulfotransferase domain